MAERTQTATNHLVTLPMSDLTMTSREIAELTGKQHKNVLRDIRTMLDQIYGQKDGSNLSHQEIQGVTFEEDNRNYISLIRLDKDHTLTLLTGYDAKARLQVVRRWQELEQQQQNELTPAELFAQSAGVMLAQERRITASALSH